MSDEQISEWVIAQPCIIVCIFICFFTIVWFLLCILILCFPFSGLHCVFLICLEYNTIYFYSFFYQLKKYYIQCAACWQTADVILTSLGKASRQPYIVYCVVCTVQYTMYRTQYCIQCTVCSRVDRIQYTVYNIQYTVYSMQFSVYSI